MLFLLPWPEWPAFYADSISQVATGLASPFAGQTTLRFQSAQATGTTHSGSPWTALVTVNAVPTDRLLYAAQLDLRRTSYIPMAVFVALGLAFRRGRLRWSQLGLGAIGLCALGALVWLPVWAFLIQVNVLRLPWLVAILIVTLCRALVLPPGMSYAMPALVWLAHGPASSRCSQIPTGLADSG